VKILVTGATGFIGRHLVPVLQNENFDLAILARSSSTGFSNIKTIEGSLTNLDAFKNKVKEFNPDVCVNLAWQGIPDYSHKISKKNLDQTIGLIDFLLDETSCRKIIMSGSCFEYGKAVGEVSENTAEENILPFAWAKNSIKNYLALRSLEKGTSWVWMRLFYVFGPGQRSNSLIPSLVSAARQRQPSPIRNPFNANDFVYVDDVATAIKTAAIQNIESGIYNIASGYLYKVSDIWQLVNKKFANETAFQVTQNGNKDNSFASAVGCFADIKKAKQLLNWAPKWTVEDGIKHFIDQLYNEGNNDYLKDTTTN
jgi:UDP-glucose 4-epimerase